MQQPGPTATKLCEISDVSQKKEYFILTLRKDSETCLITYITPDGTKYNYFITGQDISLEQGSYVDLKPSLLKTNKRLNKWKFLVLSIGTYTFMGNGSPFKETVYPESENNIDDIKNVEVIAVEGNVYSIQVSPSFLYCLHHHKDQTIIKNHLSCQDCEMPHVEFSMEFNIFKITKGREYLYPIRCRIPFKTTNLTYFAKLDTTKEHPKDFTKERTKYPEKLATHQEMLHEDVTTEGKKFPGELITNKPPEELTTNTEKLEGNQFPEKLPTIGEKPTAVSMGYTHYTAVAVPWVLLCLTWILFGIFLYSPFSCLKITKKLQQTDLDDEAGEEKMEVAVHLVGNDVIIDNKRDKYLIDMSHNNSNIGMNTMDKMVRQEEDGIIIRVEENFGY